MRSKIKAVIFDIGGVLETGPPPTKINSKYYSKSVHVSVAKKLGFSLDQYLDSIDTTYAKAFEGLIPEKKAISLLAKNLNTTSVKLKKIYIKAYKRAFKHNKELYTLAFKLKKSGCKIAVLSDQWYLSKKALMPEKYMKKFNPVVASCDVGMRKPNPEIYKLILKKLKLSASECLFIDNQKWNIEPAKKLGMQTILFKNNEQLFENKIWRNLFE